MVFVTKISDFKLIAIILNQIIATNPFQNGSVDYINEIFCSLSLKQETFLYYEDENFDNNNLCILHSYNDRLFSATVKSVDVNFDYVAVEDIIKGIKITRISVEDRSPFITGKYYISFGNTNYYCFVYFNEIETKISFKLDVPDEEKKHAKIISENIEYVGSFDEVLLNNKTTKIKGDLYSHFKSVGKKYLYYNEDFYSKNTIKEDLYIFQSDTDIKADFVDIFENQYLAFIPKRIFEKLKSGLDKNQKVKLTSNLYDDDGLPILEIKTIVKIE
ncbi:MAG: hypothetical protein ACJATI_002364 [Halioglobus sp.]|jgi:hypothetical protein